MPDSEAQRTVNKQTAARHLMHSALRLMAAREDPFAIHLLVQSADKILIDMSKQLGKPLRVDWEDYIKPEYQGEFVRRYREIYNFFKHADRDFDTELAVRDIAMSNVLGLFTCMFNYLELFQEFTDHMRIIMTFTLALFPEMIVPTGVQGYILLQEVQDMQDMTIEFFFELLETHPQSSEALPSFIKEKMEDIQDLGHFYNLTFKEFREGVRVSPRVRRIPAC